MFKRYVLVFSMLIGVNSLRSQQTGYLGKVNLDQLLSDRADTVFTETRNLSLDLNISTIANYFNCNTLVGKEFLQTALSLPISPRSSCQTVENRQNLIRALVSQPDFKAQVDNLTKEVAILEKEQQRLFSQEFAVSFCPEGLAQKTFDRPRLKYYKDISKLSFKSLLAGYFTYNLSKTNYLLLSAIVKGQKMSVSQKITSYGMLFGITGALNLYTGYLFAGYAAEHAKDYASAYNKRDLMHAINKVIVIARQLDLLCEQNGLSLQFSISKMAEQDDFNLIHELQKSRYAQEKSYAFMTPEVHALIYKMYKKDGCLTSICAAVAEIDACNAIATKILETQGQPNQFCFVKFLEQIKPQIQSTGNWNILVGDQVAVANDFTEGKNVMLSGVNAGGKTTFTRAISQNILLAQTFGIAAGTSFVFTPFDIFESYLNVSDDLINGSSLFVSEIKRAQEIKTKVESIAGTNLKYFFVLDELFTGTGADAGERCAYEFVNRIANSDQVMFVYPTHFNDVKSLGDSHVNCANYKADTAIKTQNGSLKYPFTISKGASYDSVALDIAKNANLFN